MKKVPVQVFMTREEKAALEAEAAAEGVSASLLAYRRVFNRPNAQRKPGRPPKDPRDQPEGLFPMTG